MKPKKPVKDEIRVVRRPEAAKAPDFRILPIPYRIVLREEGRRG